VPERAESQSWRYPAALLGIFAVIFVALAIAPLYRQDWLLENMLVLVAVPVLVLTRHRLRFSNLAYTCLFVFFALHEIGSHYTYSLVPYDDWSRAVAGLSINEALGFERNHYDRLIHFLYGLLIARGRRALPAVRSLPARLGGAVPAAVRRLPLRHLRADRVGRGAGIRRRARPGLPGYAGRHLGRTEGHGAGVRWGRDRGDRARSCGQVGSAESER